MKKTFNNEIAGIFLLAAGMLTGLLCGCSEQIDKSAEVVMLDSQTANLWYYNWADQQDIESAEIKDMLFVFVYKGRDWKDDEGVDGYILRVILLDKAGKAAKANGSMKVFAVEDSDTDQANAFAAWSLEPEQLESYYNDERFPCYLLQLDWGKGPKSREGMFAIVVRWESPDRKSRYTRVIELEDIVAHEVQTTKKQFPSVVGRDGDDDSNHAVTSPAGDK